MGVFVASGTSWKRGGLFQSGAELRESMSVRLQWTGTNAGFNVPEFFSQQPDEMWWYRKGGYRPLLELGNSMGYNPGKKLHLHPTDSTAMMVWKALG